MPRVRSSIDIDLFCTFLANFAPLRLTYLGLCNTLLIWTKFHFSQFNAHLATCCRHGRLQRGTCLLPLSEPASGRQREREPCLRADIHTRTHTRHIYHYICHVRDNVISFSCRHKGDTLHLCVLLPLSLSASPACIGVSVRVSRRQAMLPLPRLIGCVCETC